MEGSHNTRVDCEPGVAMAGLKQELGCHGWPVAGSGMPWLARSRIWDAMAGSITGNHGWPVAGYGNAMAGNVTGDHRI